MAKRKVCKICKMFVEGDKCSEHGDSTTESWKGRLYISDPAKSLIAEKINVKVKGEYAIKV